MDTWLFVADLAALLVLVTVIMILSGHGGWKAGLARNKYLEDRIKILEAAAGLSDTWTKCDPNDPPFKWEADADADPNDPTRAMRWKRVAVYIVEEHVPDSGKRLTLRRAIQGGLKTAEAAIGILKDQGGES